MNEDLTKKHSWISLAFVWTGSVISVSALMLGGQLVSGLGMGGALMSGLLGFIIVVILMCFQGIQCSDLRTQTVKAAAGTFGINGSRIAISSVLAIALVGWFGFQANLCGKVFSSVLMESFNINVPVQACSVFWGLMMLSTAMFGIKIMKVLNYISVPLLVLVSIFGCYKVIQMNGLSEVMHFKAVSPISFFTGVSISVGTFAVGAVIAGDISMNAINRKSVVKSSVFGLLPAGFFMILIGGILSIAANNADITQVFTALNLPILGLVTLVLATWTTNTVNAYSGGYAILNIFALSDSKKPYATFAAGIIGTLLATFGIVDHFIGFLIVLTNFIPSIAGVMITEYWLIKKGNKNNWIERKGIHFTAIVSWIFGILVSSFLKVGISAINGVFASIVLYLILEKNLF